MTQFKDIFEDIDMRVVRALVHGGVYTKSKYRNNGGARISAGGIKFKAH